MERKPFDERTVRAIRIIGGLEKGTALPATFGDVVRAVHPELIHPPNITSTWAYTSLVWRFQKGTVQRWLRGIYSKYPEGPLDRCSPEERALAEELREKLPNGYNGLCGRIRDCLGGQRDRFHVGERHV